MFQHIVEAIQNSVKPELISIDGTTYSSRELFDPPTEHQPSPLTVSGLGGLVDYVDRDPDGARSDMQLFIHVADQETVFLKSSYSGRTATRATLINADCSPFVTGFSFNTYMPLEAMIIGLQSQFVGSEDVTEVLSVLGNLREEKISTWNDDGVSQAVTTRKGIATGERTMVPRIVMLAPYRTFGEIEQPSSQFILRLQQSQRDGEPPKAGLFEADGGHWKLAAIESIKFYLHQQLNANAETDMQIPIVG